MDDKNHINSFPEYLKTLKNNFDKIESMPSDEDIYSFISFNNLESDWGIVIEDVKKDITQNILIRQTKHTNKNKMIIRSYEEYLIKLKEYFGIPTSIPSTNNIKKFIEEYSLGRIYGITVEDIKEDLDGFIDGKYEEMMEEAVLLKQQHAPKSSFSSNNKPVVRYNYNITRSYSSYNPQYTPPKQVVSLPAAKPAKPNRQKNKIAPSPQKQKKETQDTFLIDGDNNLNEGIQGIEHTRKDTAVKGYFTQEGAKRRFDRKFANRPNVSSELVEPGNQAVDNKIKDEARRLAKQKNQNVTIVSQDKGFQEVRGKRKNGSRISTAKSVKEKLKNNNNKNK